MTHTKNKLREGTEVLRTGGGCYLNSTECNEIYNMIEALERINNFPFDVNRTPVQDVFDMKEIAREALNG